VNDDVDQPNAPGEGEPERMCWLDTTPFLLNMLAIAALVAWLNWGSAS